MFVSEYFGLDNELDRIEVFDCVLNNNSRFFINLMRLKVSDVPEFKDAYQRINDYLSEIAGRFLSWKFHTTGRAFYGRIIEVAEYFSMNGLNKMEYEFNDLKSIARLLSGLGNVDFPESIKVDETALYECCYDMEREILTLDSRYQNIIEMCEDLAAICSRPDYELPEEIAEKLFLEYEEGGQLDVIQLIDLVKKCFQCIERESND